MDKKDKDVDQDDSDGSGGSEGLIPSYHELFRSDVDQKELAIYAQDALEKQRVSIKAKGYEVTALSKMQKLRNQLQDPSLDNDGGSGLDFAEHPELAEMGGMVDPNIVVLPDSELTASQIRNDPQLRNRLAAKLGMGMGLSMQSLREEHKNKMKNRAKISAPQPKPRYRPTTTPKPRPQ